MTSLVNRFLLPFIRYFFCLGPRMGAMCGLCRFRSHLSHVSNFISYRPIQITSFTCLQFQFLPVYTDHIFHMSPISIPTGLHRSHHSHVSNFNSYRPTQITSFTCLQFQFLPAYTDHIIPISPISVPTGLHRSYLSHVSNFSSYRPT